MRVPITDRHLKSIELPPPGRSRLDYDTDPHYRGFAVCVTATGSISFRCVYTTREGESRRHVFGHFPAIPRFTLARSRAIGRCIACGILSACLWANRIRSR